MDFPTEPESLKSRDSSPAILGMQDQVFSDLQRTPGYALIDKKKRNGHARRCNSIPCTRHFQTSE